MFAHWRTIVITGAALLVAGGLEVRLPAALAEASAESIAPERRYVGVEQPLMVRLAAPRDDDARVELALLDARGRLVVDPVRVRPGRADLGEVIPDIWMVRRACYVQVLHDDQPHGPALVLQPMLARLVPKTDRAERPDGSPYTRIIGWLTEEEAMEDEEPEAGGHEQNDPPSADDEDEHPPRPPQRVFSGMRVYVDADVILHTTHGAIRLAMRPEEAPNTAWNFLELSRGGFYDGVAFHRIVPLTAAGEPFVIQAGDPSRTGSGGPGYWLPIEPSELPHDFGVISMARADHPDSAGSQFFICLSREGTARLDGQYCAFGYAVDGAEVILSIADVELADVSAGRAVDPPVIRRAEVVSAPPRTPGAGRPDARVRIEQPVEVEGPAEPPGRVPR